MIHDSDVILASLKLARAMRRCPPERREYPFPPAVGRLLLCASENPGVSSRELCELLDLRPSSLSEMLSRAESEGFLPRTVDEADRRIQRVSLTEKGTRAVREMETARDEEARKKTACFTEEEKKQFCTLCDKFSSWLERLSLDLPEDRPVPPPRGPRGPHGDPPDRPDRPHFPPGTRFKS